MADLRNDMFGFVRIIEHTFIDQFLPRVQAILEELIQTKRCEKCDYCRFTKVLTAPKHCTELII